MKTLRLVLILAAWMLSAGACACGCGRDDAAMAAMQPEKATLNMTDMTVIEVGSKAPAFTRIDQHGDKHSLKDYAGQKLVIYFYPKNDTPGCTTEACEFRDLTAEFTSRGVAVLGVSPDDEASHAQFTEKYELNFPLLADPPGADGVPRMCAKYGVWRERNMYGQMRWGVARTTYLIDENGNVAHRWDNVRAAGHAEAVLALIDGK